MEITLRQWTLDDKESLIKLCNSVDRQFLSNRLPNPYTQDSADWWLNMVLNSDGKDGLFRAIVMDGEIIGNISVEKKSDVYEKDCELGYMLLNEYSGKGIMTQAVKQICELAFGLLDVIRISGLVYEPNIASSKILEKNNFTLEGVLKNAVIKNNTIHNLKIYGKLKL